ncbi:MAG: 6-bladed beta-propeller [Bacteroidales bacterium]|nr:6-bladed beta-propeller [Bacteroidales bacterium]
MKINFLSCFIILLLSLTSCSKEQHPISISVDTEAIDNTLLEQKAEIKRVILLSDSISVGKINKILLAGGNFIVWDKSDDKIICYNGEGKINYVVAAKGRGPEEYTGISNIFLSNENNSFNIISLDKKRLRYSIATGSLQEISQIDEPTMMISDASLLPDSSLAISILGPHHNLAICKPGKSKHMIPFNTIRDFAFMEKAFCYDGTDMLFIHGMDNNIYRIDSDTATVKYEVNFNGREIANYEYDTKNQQQLDAIFKSRKVATKMDNLYADQNHISFSYWLMEPDGIICTRYALHKIKEGITYNITQDSAELFPIRENLDGAFVSAVAADAAIIARHTDKKAGVTFESNPAIVIWTFIP